MAYLLNRLRLATAAGGEGELLQEVRRGKGQRVHVFRSRRVNRPSLGQNRALRLGLARRLDDRHAHEPEELLRVVVLFLAHLPV